MTERFGGTSDEHYSASQEQGRLWSGHGHLERVRTQELLARFLPSPPATVLDVGGGAGVHAHWLADHGYEVHLIDAVPLHVEQALAPRMEPGARPLASGTVGDARALEVADESIDAVLLLGPLYHLTERFDRIQALQEARRVVRPGGLIAVAVISRFASLFDGFWAGFLQDPDFAAIVERDIATGQHRNPTNHPNYFTTAYFHHPDELRTELSEAGLKEIQLLGIEGPARWLLRDFSSWWEDESLRERILAAARDVESESSLLGVGPHIMGIGYKR